MKKLSSILLIAILSLTCRASSLDFSPLVRNFTIADYSSGRQNWSLTQSIDGKIYVGNSNGLLEFDNNSWIRYSLPDKGLVRAVHYGIDGRVYIGAYHEFGYLERGSEPSRYVSLSAKYPELLSHNDEVWNIVTDPRNGNIIFQTFSSFFIYDGNELSVIREYQPLNIMVVGSNLYFQNIDGDFKKFIEDYKAETVIPENKLGCHIVSALPHREGILLLTDTRGGFIMNDGKLYPWKTGADESLKSSIINRAVVTSDKKYVVGTISGGVFAFKEDGTLEWMLNLSRGLQNNTVLGLLCDHEDNIWLAMDDGISYIDRTSGISVYRPHNEMIGMIYDMLPGKEVTYMATNQGLYQSKDGILQRIPGMEMQTWFVEMLSDKIYVGHNDGIYSIEDGRPHLMTDIGGGAFCMERIYRNDMTWIVAGTYNAPCMYKIKDDGSWELVPVLENTHHMVSEIEYDGHGNIWCEHFKNGLVKIRLSQDLRTLKEEVVYDTLGDVSDTLFSVMKINERMVFYNGKNFFTYDDINDEIIPYTSMNRDLHEMHNIHQALYVRDGLYWLVGDRDAVLVDCRKDSFKELRRIPFSMFGVPVEERASMVCETGTSISYLLMTNLIVKIDIDTFISPFRDTNTPLTISQIKAIDRNGKEVDITMGNNNRISYRYNTISISLRYPVYSAFDVSFRYRLSGLSEEWIKSDKGLNQIFHRLRSGKYVFTVEAVASSEVLTSTSHSFTISSPWYLSWWMCVIYVIMVILMMRLSSIISIRQVKIENRRRLEDQKQKMREQKEFMLEEDIRQKSKDIASMSLTVIAHNEVLNSILKEIQDQKLNRSSRGLDKILHIVKTSMISNKEQWDMFQTNFDRIHENFFRRLKDAYPELTSTDLRMCALLRLNLSTKDIANILNLTVRGVESARYRLRKKINLPAEASLTDFIINFK